MSDPLRSIALDRAALAALEELVGDDPKFIAELIDDFLDDGPSLVAEMQVAAAAGDAATLRRTAHTLKSNCRTFGATALADVCQDIEARAAAGEVEAVPPLLRLVATMYPGVAAALHAERRDA